MKHQETTVGALLNRDSQQNDDLWKQDSRRNALKAAALAAALACSLALITFSPLGKYCNPATIALLKDRLALYHAWAPWLFLLGGSALVAMGVPRLSICTLGGMLFGFAWGALLGNMASLLGSAVIYFFTRQLGRPLLRQKFSRAVTAIDEHIKAHEYLIVMLLRQLPVPCMGMSIILGLSSVSTGAFFAGSIVSMFPQSAVFALFGSGVHGQFGIRVSVASTLLVILALCLRVWYRKFPFMQKIVRAR